MALGLPRVDGLNDLEEAEATQWLGFWLANPQGAFRDDTRQMALVAWLSYLLGGQGAPPDAYYPYFAELPSGDDLKRSLDEWHAKQSAPSTSS